MRVIVGGRGKGGGGRGGGGRWREILVCNMCVLIHNVIGML